MPTPTDRDIVGMNDPLRVTRPLRMSSAKELMP